jgi:hypothetical protein
VAGEHDETGVRSADATEVLSRDAVFRSQVNRELCWDRVEHAALSWKRLRISLSVGH